MKKEGIKSKKGQLSLFIIIAIIIVVLFIGAFYFINQNSEMQKAKKDPSGYVRTQIQACAEQAAEEAERSVILHGGFSNPTNYMMFNNTKVTFLCYAENNLELCINNHPMLNLEIQKQIESYVKPKLEKCFNDVKEMWKDYNYKEENLVFTTEIQPKELKLNIAKKISFTVSEQTINLETFNTKISSPLYDFVRLTNEIINQELDCNCGQEACNAKTVELMKNNQNFEVTKPVYSGKSEEVYRITESITGKTFNFAIRNCVRVP